MLTAGTDDTRFKRLPQLSNHPFNSLKRSSNNTGNLCDVVDTA